MKRKIFLLSLMAVVFTLAIAGCQREGCTDPKATNYDSDAKKDNGTCVYPEPVVPTKVIIIDWDWNVDSGWVPSKDSIKYYTSQPDVKDVYINLMNKKTDHFPEETGCVFDGCPSSVFRRARDTMQTRFDMSEKVRGSGTILVNRDAGAQLPDAEHGIGMALEDSTWFASHGFNIERRR